MADDLTLSARVSADLSSFTRELARGPALARQFGAEVSRAINANVRTPRINVDAIAGQGTTAGRAFGQNLERELTAARPFESITAQANRAALAIAGAFGVREAVQAADAWQNAANRLRLVSDSAEQARATQERLFAVAQETRTAYAGTVDVFQRFARATASLGISQRGVLDVTRAINQALAISGTSGDSAQQALEQLGQGLQSGTLQGEELRSVLEQAPRLAQAIADGLGKSVGELRAMGAAGQLTTQVVFGALAGQAATIAAEFEQMAPTIGQAFTQVENAVQRYIGTTSQASGTGQALAGSLTALADNFEAVANAAALAAAAIGARLIGRGIDSAVGQVRQQVVAYKDQQQAIIQATFAENAHAQAIAVTAAEDVKTTQQRIANLRRVDAEIERQIALERNRLAAAAVSIDRAQTVPLSSLAPLGGAAVEREARARAAAEAVVAQTSRNILLLDEQREIITARLTEQILALSVAEGAEAGAARLAAVADTTHKRALDSMTLSARAGALATEGLEAALAFFGGGIGLAITGIGVAMAYAAQHTTAAEKAARDYAAELDEVRKKAEGAGIAIADMTANQRSVQRLQITDDLRKAQDQLANVRRELAGVEVDKAGSLVVGAGQVTDIFHLRETAQYNVALEDLRGQFRDNAITSDQFAAGLSRLAQQFPRFTKQARELQDQVFVFQALDAKVQTLTGSLRELNRASTTAAAPKAPPVVKDNLSALEEEAARLGKLREAGIANAQVMARVAEITREAQTELTRLGKLDLSGDAAKQAQEAMIEYQKIIDTLTGDTRHEREIKAKLTLEERAAKEKFDQFVTDAEATVIRLHVATELGAGQSERLALTQDVVRAEAEVTAEIERRGGARAQDVEAVQRLLQTLGRLKDATRLEVAITVPKVDLGSIKLPPIRVDAFNPLTDAAADYVAEATKAQRATERLADALGQVSSAGRGLESIAGAFDNMPEGVSKALNGVLAMVDGFEALARAKADAQQQAFDDPFNIPSDLTNIVSKLPGIVGVIGGVVGLVSSLFHGGPSPITAALDKNREALDALGVDLRNVRASFANLTRANTAALAVARNPQVLERDFRGQVFGQIDRASLDRALAELGTNFGELSNIAEQFGITLVDSKGRLLQPAFQQLADAMLLARRRALSLGDSFGDLQHQGSVRLDLFNLDTPEDAWNEAVREAQRLLPAQIANQIAGLRIDTDAGQQAAREFIQRLFTQGSAGQLSDILFQSGFENIGEFFDFLVTLEDPLDQLGTAAERAAQALSDVNLPPGFRRGLAEWAATAPDLSQLVNTIQTAPVQPYTPPTTYVPPATQQRPSDASTAQNRRPEEGSVVIQNMVVYPRDFDDFERQTRTRARTEARARGGARAASQYAD